MSTKITGMTALQEVVLKTKQLVASIKTITYSIVQTLPTASATTYFDDSKTVYMVRNSASTGTDFYEEYITIRSGSAGSYTYSWEKIGDTQIDLSGYVPTSRKVNNKALTSDITLDAGDVGAVPTTRKVNNKALSSDVTLSASDVGAEPTISSKGSAFNKDFEDTDANIQMNGTADAGTSTKVARADHVHPHDTSKQDILTSANAGDNITIETVNNILKISASGLTKINANSVRITNLSAGVYAITTTTQTVTIYYNGTAGTEYASLPALNDTALLYVTKDKTTQWTWFAIYTPTTNDNTSIMWGKTNTSSGYKNAKALGMLATTSDLPTKTSDLINDGSDGTSTFIETDELVEITAQEVDALFA